MDGPDGHRLFANRGWMEFTGAEPDAGLGLAWRERIHPADRERYEGVRAAGGPFEVEYRLRAADGRHRWVLDRGAPVEGDHGGSVGGCLDIDTRVRERERQRLLAVVGAALDRETTVPGRRAVLARALVDEGLVDLVRFIAVEDGTTTGERVVAARTPEQEAVLDALDDDWMQAREAVAAGEVRHFAVDEAFIAASTSDERQRTLRRSVGFRSVVLVPVAARGHASGLLAVARTHTSAPFDEADVALLVELGERAGTAVDNAMLLQREQANRARLEALQRATAALSAAATPEQVARAAAEQFALLSRATAVTLWRLSPAGDGDGVLEAVDLDAPVDAVPGSAPRIPLDTPAAPALAARSRAPVWADPEQLTAPDCIPLIAAGTCVGVVGLAGHPRDLRTGAGGAALTVLAKLCAQALQRAGLLAAERAARHTAEELGEVVGALSGATTPTAVAEVVLDHVVRLGATAAAVLLRKADHLEVLATRGQPEGVGRLPLDAASPAALAARTGQVVWRGRRPAGRGAAPARRPDPAARGARALGRGARLRRRDRPGRRAHAGRAVRPGVGPGAAAPGRARRRRRPAAQPAALRAARAAPAQRRRPLPAQRRRRRGRRRLVRPAADRRDARGAGRRRRRRARGGRGGRDGPAAQRAGRLPARRPLPRRRAGAARPLRPPGARSVGEHLRLPGARLHDRRAALGAGRAPPGAAARTGRSALPRRRRRHGPRASPVARRTRRPDAVIEPGSSVLLYTDGLVERRGEVVDEGQERLARAAAAIRDLAPDAVVAALIDAALGDTAQPDDVALVAVRLVPEPLQGRLPAQPRQLRVMRRAVEEWAAAVGLPDDVLDDLQYALGEAAANAVEHAYGGLDDGGDFSFTLTHLPGVDGGDGGVAVEVSRPGPLAARARRLGLPRAWHAGAARDRARRPHRQR